MAKLLHCFEERGVERRRETYGRMTDFLALFEQRHREAVVSGPPDFNVLSLCGITTDEVRHSAIIGWLLDETGSHGQGRLFFDGFTHLCGFDLPATNLPYKTMTEFSCLESIVDVVVLRRREFILFLENKTVSVEGPDQLNREYRDLQRRGESLGVPPAQRYSVFLTPDGRVPVTGKARQWRCLSYADIVTMLMSVMPEVQDMKLKLFLNDWMETVSDLKG